MRISAISTLIHLSLAILASFMFKLVATPLSSGFALGAFSCFFNPFLSYVCGSVGAMNQILRHNDFNAKMYTSEKRSCRYFAFV